MLLSPSSILENFKNVELWVKKSRIVSLDRLRVNIITDIIAPNILDLWAL